MLTKFAKIELEVNRTTVEQEISHNTDPEFDRLYSACRAEQLAIMKRSAISSDNALKKLTPEINTITDRLAVHTSPEVISGELHNEGISLSKNTMRRLYLQQDRDKGRMLYRTLPHRGKYYKHQNMKSKRVKISDLVGIEQPPTPLYNSNTIEMNLIDSEEFHKDMIDTYHKILSSVVTPPLEESVIEVWIKALSIGRFTDIAYPPTNAEIVEDDVSQLYKHLTRVDKILNFARQDADKYRNYYNASAEAIDFYTESNFPAKNWWHRQVGLAKVAAKCLILLAENPPDVKFITSIQYLKNTTNIAMGQTGANQADFAYIQLIWAVAGWKISSDDQYISSAYEASEAVSRLCLPVSRDGVEEGEGISIDYSFSQHNPNHGQYSQIYAGSYGFVHLNNIFKFINLLSGSLSLKASSIRHIEKFIIKGMGWFCYGGVYDFHVCGRAISRGMERNGSLSRWCKILLNNNPSNPDVLNEIIRRSEGDEENNSYYRGGRAYWVNDYLCHFYKGFAFWCKTISTRTVGSESGNGENLKGYYVGCGSYFISKNGKEYSDIQLLWDWQRIPGTTVEQIPEFNYPLIDWGYGSWGSHDYSGAMGDEQVGVSSMILSKGNVKNSKKTAICLENYVLFMGASIDTLSASFPVFTSVNQSFRNGEITVIYKNGYSEKLTTGQRRSTNISEVVHDGFRYVFRNNQSQVITVDTKIVSGTWTKINKGKLEDVLQGEIFSLWIEHKKGQDENYCYEIHSINNDIESNGRIINSSNCQMFLSDDGDLALGSVYILDDSYIKMNSVKLKILTPLTFIVRNIGDDKLELTVSDLSQKLEEAEIFLDWGYVQYSRKLPLPNQDNFKGQSVRFVLTANEV